MKTTLSRCLLVTVFALSPLQAPADQWRYDDVERVVAIADIHGAYDAMVETLQNAGVIGADLEWIAADSHLVIVGDILNRGAGSRDAMDLLIALEGQADTAGGKLHVLIGNHEAMNLVGDLRYVARDDFAAYAKDETADERETWLAAYAARKTEAGQVTDELRVEFDERFPPGYFAHRRAFAADGKYGAWLLQKPLLIVINGTAFVHAGLSPLVADLGMQGVNDTLRREMEDYVRNLGILVAAGVLLPTDDFYSHSQILDTYMPSLDTGAEVPAAVAAAREFFDSELNGSYSPLWYRGNVACTRVVEEDRLQSALTEIDAKRVVFGHTPTPGRRVLQRFEGSITEIDTGMLAEYYGGSGHALVLEGDRVEVIRQASRDPVKPVPHPRQVGKRPGGFLSADATATLLATGELSNERQDAAGRRIVTVSDGNRRIDAVFARRAGREFYPEMAAYKLDRLFELNMVPVTVLRKVGRNEGSLQFLPPKLSDERQRSETGSGGFAHCPLDLQWSAMYVFDALIFNEGRTLNRMVYHTDVWNLILVGHDKAFTTSRNRPRHLADVDLAVGPTWRDALTALSDEVIEEEFAGLLDRRRRDALAARRDALLGE